MVARFLHDRMLTKVTDRDTLGWSPLCFAVVQGDAALVKALLDRKADANDHLPFDKKEANLNRKMTVLALAAAYHNNEVVSILIAARANVDGGGGRPGTALCWAASSDNASAVRIFCEANADPRIKAFWGLKLGVYLSISKFFRRQLNRCDSVLTKIYLSKCSYIIYTHVYT